jgi:hypothetical protein
MKYIKLILSSKRHRRYMNNFHNVNDQLFYIWNQADDFMKSIPDSWWNRPRRYKCTTNI